jgi:outer membrane protein TolC
MASFLLSWELFKGFQNHALIEKKLIERDILLNKRKEIEQQILLQVNQAYYEIIYAQKSFEASKDEVISADKSFDIINKQYKEGMTGLLQYLDAQTIKTNARKKRIIAQYELWQKYIELERFCGVELIYE